MDEFIDEEEPTSTPFLASSEGCPRCIVCDTSLSLFLLFLFWSLLLVLVTVVVSSAFHLRHQDARALYVPPCSLRGVWMPASQRCSCFDCAAGPSCESLLRSPSPLCNVSAAGSRAFLMQDWWNNATIASGFPETAKEALNQHVVSMRDGDAVQIEAEGIFSGSSQPNLALLRLPEDTPLIDALQRVHSLAKNANTTSRSFVFAQSVSHLFSALAYASIHLSSSSPSSSPNNNNSNTSSSSSHYIVEQTPASPHHAIFTSHFRSFSPQGSFFSPSSPPSALQLDWRSSSEGLDPSRVVQLLSLPSQPLGEYPLWDQLSLEALNAPIFFDLSFHWPHLSPGARSLSLPVAVFDLSQLTGHASLGFCWAIVEDPALASLAGRFLALLSLSPSPWVKSRALDVLQAVDPPYFAAIRRILSGRWQRIMIVMEKHDQTRFELLSAPRTAFLVLSCVDPRDAGDCSAVFAAVGIQVSPGRLFGLNAATVSINLLLWHHAFDVFLDRFEILLST